MTFGLGFRSIARLCSGLWSYLTAKVNGRAAVALERERNLGTVEVIKALPQGVEVVDYAPNGGLRVIRMASSEQHPLIAKMPQIPLPAIEPPTISSLHAADKDLSNGDPCE